MIVTALEFILQNVPKELENLWSVWQYELWSFQMGDTKLERFLPKNQHTQRKLLNFGLMASCQKVPKFDFQSQFSMSKIIRIFLIFFH